MNRPIKFRQRVLGRFHYWGFIDDAFIGPVNPTDPSDQFTGLTDEHGREIWEGDKARVTGTDFYSNESFSVDDDPWEFIGTVEMNSFMWIVNGSDGTYIPFWDILQSGLDVEVIANIYESAPNEREGG